MPEPNASKVLAIVNQKGGVGKTTTAINLSAALALQGVRCLLIDIDPQANTTGGLGFPRDDERASAYDLLMGNVSAREAIVPTSVDHLELIPGTKNMVGANIELVGSEGREYRLREALTEIRDDYSFIFLDCPPALDFLTLNALTAADGLLVPMQAEYFALEGISELISTLDKVAAAFNPGLSLEGIVLSMFDERMNLSQQVRENLRSFFDRKLFTTSIPRNIRLAEAPSHGIPAVVYDPKSRGAEAYFDLSQELLERNNMIAPNPRPGKRSVIANSNASSEDEE
ncbi:MAG TPA: ParA family protein [Acidobacteriaceae bacterium]|jgi:chromosome partitioning protein